MYAAGMLGSYLTQGAYAVAGPFQPFGGAVDIIVVQQEGGTSKSSPWYVKFGDFQGREKIVHIAVNDVPADFHMFLNSKGEAYFENEAECDGGAGSASLHSATLSGDAEEKVENTTSTGVGETRMHATDASVSDSDVQCAAVAIASGIQNVVVEENVQVLQAPGRFFGNIGNVNHASNLTMAKTEAASLVGSLEVGLGADTRERKLVGEAWRIKEAANVQESVDSQELANAAYINNTRVNISAVNNSLSSVDILTAGEELATHISKEEDANRVGSVLTSNAFGDNLNRGFTEDMGLTMLVAQHSLETQPTCNVDTISDEPFGVGIPNRREENIRHMVWSEVNSPENVELCSAKGSLEVRETCKVIIRSDSYFSGCMEEKFVRDTGTVLDKNKEVLSASSIDPLLEGRDMRTDAGAGEMTHEQLDRDSTVLASDVWKNQGTSITIPDDNGYVAGEKSKDASIAGKDVVDTMERRVLTDGGTSNKDSGSQHGAVIAPIRWSLRALSFRRPRVEKGSLFPSKTADEALLVAATKSTFAEGALQQKNGYHKWPQNSKVRTYVPTSAQLASLKLKEGANKVTFTFSRVLGKTQVDARIYLWKWNTRIVISDVDGTITKSDVLGQVMPLVGRDWSQLGVTRLFSAIKDNGYEVLFLSARAISQAYLTRQFLLNLKQDGEALPEGPMVISPDGLIPSLYREVVRRAPHEFKISCLEGIRELFPRDVNPFYAGFGNRATDEISYLKVGIPKGKIFIINPKGEVVVNNRVDRKSYRSLHALVDDMFPPTFSSEQEDFNSWNFWKLPVLDVKEELSATSSKSGKKSANVKKFQRSSSTR